MTDINKDNNKEKILNENKNINQEEDCSYDLIKRFENEPEEIVVESVKNNTKDYDKSIKIIMIGDCKVGKTSIIHRLTENKYSEKYTPSISLEYTNYCIKLNDYIIRMQIWDTSGQEKYEFNSIISNYYKTADVAIFVYSIDDIKTFNNIEEYVKDLISDNEEDINIKKVLLGNKSDLLQERKVDKTLSKTLLDEINFEMFSEISCKCDNSAIKTIFNNIGKLFYNEYSRLSNSSSFHYSAGPSILDDESREQSVKNNNTRNNWCFRCAIF